jgi:hypothetical protein
VKLNRIIIKKYSPGKFNENSVSDSFFHDAFLSAKKYRLLSPDTFLAVYKPIIITYNRQIRIIVLLYEVNKFTILIFFLAIHAFYVPDGRNVYFSHSEGFFLQPV